MSGGALTDCVTYNAGVPGSTGCDEMIDMLLVVGVAVEVRQLIVIG